MRRLTALVSLIALASALALAAVAGPSGPAGAAPSGGRGEALTVQTYNVDLGADLAPLFGAPDLPSLQGAAARVYAEAEASRPEERMRAVAEVISAERPDVVGLQEVALWSLAPYQVVNGFPVTTGPYQPSYDFLAMLLADLARRGQGYDAVAVNTNFDSGTAIPIAVPISATTAARYTDRNVILVRHKSGLQAGNAQQANFRAAFTVNLLGGTVAVPRGWTSVDLTRRGRTVRLIDTHLEAYGLPPLKDQVRNPQAVELAALATASPYPTMVVGDINARPDRCATWRQPPVAEDANVVAYTTLVKAGLREVWPLVHPRDPCSPAGWTSGQTSLQGPVSTLTHRIDDIFLSAGLTAQRTSVVGDTARDRSHPNGLWPSDHASSVAVIRLTA